MSFDKPVVVIDNGSYTIKSGFACDNHPVSIFRTAVGRPKSLQGTYGRGYYDVSVGDDALAKDEDLELCSPIQNGRIVHWDNMERIWHHIFYRELKAAPDDRAVMMAIAIGTPMKDKIKCCEVLFETLNTPGLCLQSQCVLSLYGSGFTTGISVDLGHDTTDVVPIYEGGPITYAHIETKYATKDIINFINMNLKTKGRNVNAEMLEGIEKMVYITQDTTMPRKDYRKMYKLPSGEEIEVSEELFMAGEKLFSPELVKDCVACKDCVIPLQEAVVTSASKCDPELESELYNAVVPCGEMAMIPGLCDRLGTEVEKLSKWPVNVVTPTESYAMAWLGGATFAGMPSSRQLWVSKKQFEENGVRIVRNKFM